jgi:hypothetical protein
MLVHNKGYYKGKKDVIPLFSNYFCEFQQLILHLKLRQSSYQDVGT